MTKRSKTFLATWRPAGGVVRVVILEADDGSWRAFLGTEAQASVAAIVPTVLERWAIEPDFHDRTEVERIEPGQWCRVGSKVGALHLSLWVPARTAVWGWSRPAEERSARTDSPWEDAERRPSQADRRKALPREMREEEYRRIGVPQPWSEKIRHLLAGVVRLAA